MGTAQGALWSIASLNGGTEILGGEGWCGLVWVVPCGVAGDAQGPPGPGVPTHSHLCPGARVLLLLLLHF